MNLAQSILITLSYWIATICEGASRIIIPLYFHSIGFSPSKIALLFFFNEAFSFLTNYLSGIILNRMGYKKAFILSMLAHTLASGLYLLPSGLMANIFTLALIRSLRGIGKELSKSTTSVYTKVLQDKKGDRKKTNNLIHIILGGKDAVKGVGIFVGTMLYVTLGFHYSFALLTALTGFVVLLSVPFLRDYREKQKVQLSGIFKVSRIMVTLSAIRGLLYAGRDMWWAVALPLYIISQGGTEESLGTTLALGLVVFGLAQTFGGVIIKKEIKLFNTVLKPVLNYQQAMPVSNYLLMLIPLTMILLKENTTYLLMLILIYNFFAGVATAPHNALHISLANPQSTSIDVAFYKTFSGIGEVLSVAISGIIYQYYGISMCLHVAALVIFFAGTLSMWLPENEYYTHPIGAKA